MKNLKKNKKISGGDGSATPLNLLLQGELLALTVQLAPNKALSLSLSPSFKLESHFLGPANLLVRPVLPIFLFAQVGITEIVLVRKA